MLILCWKWGLGCFHSSAEPLTKGLQSVCCYWFTQVLPYFFMCFMYSFQPLLPDPHSNMNMTYDHCRLLREKHNDKVSVLNWNKFVPILAHGVWVGFMILYYDVLWLPISFRAILFSDFCQWLQESLWNISNRSMDLVKFSVFLWLLETVQNKMVTTAS